MLAEAATALSDKAQVIAALRQASAETGSDFHYLLGTAMRESGLKTCAQAGTSSASGLFQFVGQTWLGLVKEHGSKYGLGAYANAISRDGDGHFRVDDAKARQAILALRNDPKIAALMAGEFTNSSKSALEGALGRNVCEGELYAAHFLGPSAAAKLIQMSEAMPSACAADAFPQAASANRNVFYRADGTPKSVREVYDWALKQPGARNARLPLQTARSQAPALNVSGSNPTSGQDLLTSLLAWSPQRPSFSALDDDAQDASSLPTTPFLLTPGVMDVLSQISPAHS
jgi:hypothetical protein